MLGLLLERIREAGAASESDTERNGFLSYAAETHAVGYGLTFGTALALATAGYPHLLTVVLAVYFGIGATRYKRNERVWREIREEPQYFGPSILAGFVVVGLVLVWLGALAP